MNIGIIGKGAVGSAIKYGFEMLGHKVPFHDIAYNTTIQNVLDTNICYICVPTPANNDGSCDTSIVDLEIGHLSENNYKGIVAIKSTVIPGTTALLQEKYKNLEICFVPEFLRERFAIADFTENHDICIIGTEKKEVFELVKESHGRYPRKFIQLTPAEAEFCKYFNNIYNATLITFANSFNEVCQNFNVNYTKIKEAMVQREHITNIYLDSNENIKGFGGMCLPKDTKAFANLCIERNIPVAFFKTIVDENKKYPITVFEGMRK